MVNDVYVVYVIRKKKENMLSISSGDIAIFGNQNYRALTIMGSGRNGIGSKEDLESQVRKSMDSLKSEDSNDRLKELRNNLVRLGFSVSSGTDDAFHS